MNLRELAESRISLDADVCSGKARIKGTRVTVADIILALAEGLSELEILRAHRAIRSEDIKAAVAYCYCLTDKVQLNISGNSGSQSIRLNDADTQLDLQSSAQQEFAAQLEAQAAIQEEITKQREEAAKAKKAAKAATKKAPVKPVSKDEILSLTLGPNESFKVFDTSAHFEQVLIEDITAHIFPVREDGKQWLVYSDLDGVDIDRVLKRYVRLTFPDKNGPRESVFDAYLTRDREYKVLIERIDDKMAGGTAM